MKAQFNTKFQTIGLGSAAMCNGIEFAPFAHGHDYSDIWYFSSYGPNSYNSDPSNRNPLCCVYDGKFTIVKYEPGVNKKSTYQISAWQPSKQEELRNELSVYNQHKVGDVQLLAVNDFYTYLTAYRGYSIVDGNIDINASSFDGYVIPNGKEFICPSNKFYSACAAYSANKSRTATRFTVPNLTNTFFKCDPGLPTSQMTPLANVAGTVALPAHNHNGKMMSDGQTTTFTLKNLSFEVRGTNVGAQYQNAIHYSPGGTSGKNTSVDDYVNGVYPQIQTINLTCNASEVTCHDSGDNEEAYPDYVNIQMLLYIGKQDE